MVLIFFNGVHGYDRFRCGLIIITNSIFNNLQIIVLTHLIFLDLNELG